MDHESARAGFTSYHDGDLSDADRRSLEEHLAACPECAAEWDAYRRAIEEVSGLRVVAPSASFARQVSLEIERRRLARPFPGLSLLGVRITVLSLVLIMLLLMAYLTYLLLFTSPDPPKPPDDGATKHNHSGVEVIGPVHVEPPQVEEKQP
jgi:anti-sigma factor RsiW